MENIVTEKRCVKCGEIKSIDDFHNDKASKDGHDIKRII